MARAVAPAAALGVAAGACRLGQVVVCRTRTGGTIKQAYTMQATLGHALR